MGQLKKLPLQTVHHRLRKLSVINLPFGFLCILLFLFYADTMADKLPFLLTSLTCFLGPSAYYLLLSQVPKVKTWRLYFSMVLYMVCLLSVLWIVMQFLNTLFSISTHLYTEKVWIVIGFILIDGTEHFIYKWVDGNMKWTLSQKKFGFQNCYGGALWQLIRKSAEFRDIDKRPRHPIG